MDSTDDLVMLLMCFGIVSACPDIGIFGMLVIGCLLGWSSTWTTK